MEFEQLDLLATAMPSEAISKPIRLIELFAGIGAQAKALENLKADFESYRVVEWNAFSILGYNAIHVKDFNDYSIELTFNEVLDKLEGVSLDWNKPATRNALKRRGEAWCRKVYSSMVAIRNPCPDISRLKAVDLNITDLDKYEYVMTYSFPCQDLSHANSKPMSTKGMEEGSHTRSSLLWQVSRILHELAELNALPQTLVMENVPAVAQGENLKPFNKWLAQLDALGYKSSYQILTASDYGLPQSRSRLFMVSRRGGGMNLLNHSS